MTDKSPVTLRKKTLSNGAQSLYLDIYVDGRRRYEFLKIYLNPGNDPLTKAKNSASLKAARVIQARRVVEIQSHKAGIPTDSEFDMTMLDFFNQVIESKKTLDDRYVNLLENTREKWVAYAGPYIKVRNITADTIRGFIKYLKTCEEQKFNKGLKTQLTGACRVPTPQAIVDRVVELRAKGMTQRACAKEVGISRATVGSIERRLNKKPKQVRLSPASVKNYFDRLNTVLNKAVRLGIIGVNPITRLDACEKPRTMEHTREYLTIEEVRAFADAPCKDEMSKQMFLFACFTGLRFSDVCNVTWKMVDEKKVVCTMEKTDRVVAVPLSPNAMRWLPSRGECSPKEKVFKDHRALAVINRYISQTAKAAGIEKHVSFHVSRHTFATLELFYGVDLYTVSKLLGHTNVSTTQIYAKVMDSKKEEAVNLIPEL